MDLSGLEDDFEMSSFSDGLFMTDTAAGGEEPNPENADEAA